MKVGTRIVGITYPWKGRLGTVIAKTNMYPIVPDTFPIRFDNYDYIPHDHHTLGMNEFKPVNMIKNRPKIE